MGAPIVEARGLVKTYRTDGLSVPALRGVDLTIARGEFVAIMGPSGCGKTTLLNCLAGIEELDAGEVWVEGKLLSSLSDAERTAYRAQRMGFVFQAYNLLPILNAVENVELPLLVNGVSGREARRRAMEALEAVGLAHRARHRPAQLSGGQQQRVAIARALVNNPALIFADEPTGNLDSEAAAEIMALFRRLNRERGQTCILVTHSREIGRQCDRIVTMRDGRIIAAGERLAGGVSVFSW